MCPVCMASAALMAGSLMTTGGFTALAAKIFGSKKSLNLKNTTERRIDDGYCDEQEGNSESRAASRMA